MKILAVSAMMLLMSIAYSAELNGTLDRISPIKVQKDDLLIETYSADKLTYVALEGDTLWLDQGFRSRCMKPRLGSLLEDIVIRVKTNEGAFKTIIIEKETAERKIDIWGNCKEKSTELEELVLTVRKGSIQVLP